MRRATLLSALVCLVLSLAPCVAFALDDEGVAETNSAISVLAVDEPTASNPEDAVSDASQNDIGKASEEGGLETGFDSARVPGEDSLVVSDASLIEESKTVETIDGLCDTTVLHEQNSNESIIVQDTESDPIHEHEWGDWVQTKAPTYSVDGVETRTCQSDPTHVETRVVSAFGPSENNLSGALANGGYGNDVGVRLLYTRPVELHYLTEEDNKSPYEYRTVPIDLSNPVIQENDIAVRYTGDQPYLVVVYMGSDNGWHGWTTVGASKVAAAADDTGQSVAIFSWESILERWNNNFDNPASYQAKERAAGRSDPMFDMMCVAVNKNKACTLTEVVSLSNKIHTRPTMRDASKNLTAAELVKELYAGYNLAGMFESHWKPTTPAKDGGWSQADINLEAHWSRGTYVTKQTISDLKERGFKAIRIPVTWYQHIYKYDGNPYHIDRAWMQRVHEVVDWCLEEDFYVIINIHHEDWINRPDLDTAYEQTDLKRRFAAVWGQIAHEFDGYDQRLIFEDLNEPRASGEGVSHDREWGTPWPGDVQTINNLHRDFVALIRGMSEQSRHRERLIMTPLYSAGEEHPELHYVIPNDPSNMLAISVHNYTPHNYTHYDDGGKADHEIEGKWADCAYTNSYREQLYRSFQNIRLNFTSRGVPVVLGEFGCYYHGESRQADRLAWMADYIAYAKQLGLPCFIWGMDRTTSDGVKVWNVYDQDLNEWSSKSNALIDRWFEILENPTITWGEKALISADEHPAIESGIALSFSKDAGQDFKHIYKIEGNDQTLRTGTITATQSMFDGKDVAVKFTGATPRLAVCDAKWKGWTHIEPYYVDKAKGIAYFSEKSIDWVWDTVAGAANSTMGPLAKLFVATQGLGTAEAGGTWVYAVALLDQDSVAEYGDPFRLSGAEAVLASAGFEDITDSVSVANRGGYDVPLDVGQLSGKVIGGFRLSGDERVKDAEVSVIVAADAAREGDVLALYRLSGDSWTLATYAQVAGGAFLFETAGIMDSLAAVFAVVNKSLAGGPEPIDLATLEGADYPTRLWNAIKQGGSFSLSPDVGVVSANKFYLNTEDRYANRLEFHGLSLYCTDTAEGGKNNGFTFAYSGNKELFFKDCTFDHCDFLFNQVGTYVFVNCTFVNFPRNAIASQADGAKVFVCGCSFIDNAPDKDIWNSNVDGDRHANYAAIRMRGNNTTLRVAGSTFSNLQTDSTVIVQARSGTFSYDNVTVCFERNTVVNCGGAGVVLDSSARGRVDANTFTNIGATRGMNGYQSTINDTLGEYDEHGNGLPGAGVGGNALFARGSNYQMRVRGNTITNVMENGIEGTYYCISDNTVDTTGYRYDDDSGDSYNSGYKTVSTDGISADGTWFVTGNTVINVHQRGITITRWRNHAVVVSGNTISRREGGSTYAESSEGIKIRTDSASYVNVTVSGNVLSGFENNYRVLHSGDTRTCEGVVIEDANDGKLAGSVYRNYAGVKLTTARDVGLPFANGGTEAWRQSNLTSFTVGVDSGVEYLRMQPKDANGRIWQSFDLPDQTCIVCLEIKVRSSNPTVRVFVTSRDDSGAMLEEADGGSYREYKISVEGIDADGFTTQYVCFKARGKTDVGFWTIDGATALDIANVRGWYATDEPTAAADPDEPAEPQNPEEPADPDDPDNPVNPNQPDKPDDSKDPDTPDDPSGSEKSDQPGNSSDSDKPGNPEDPGSPNRPGDSNDSDASMPSARYHIVLNPDGVWVQGNGIGYTFSSNADFSKFVAVLVDGVSLDPANYTAVSGSTKVTLHADYLATLAAGVHTAVIRSSDGDASTTFTVSASSDVGDGDEEPNWGDGPASENAPEVEGGNPVKAIPRDDGSYSDEGAPSAAMHEQATALPKTGDSRIPLVLLVCAVAAGFSLIAARRRFQSV